jgi:hypothetical protein
LASLRDGPDLHAVVACIGHPDAGASGVESHAAHVREFVIAVSFLCDEPHFAVIVLYHVPLIAQDVNGLKLLSEDLYVRM